MGSNESVKWDILKLYETHAKNVDSGKSVGGV